MRRALGAAIAVVIAVSCSAPSTPPLRVVRISPMHAVAPFARSVSDAAAAQQLYLALASLPAAQERWCPISYGIGYRVTFSDTSRALLAAMVESDGCRVAILPGNDRRATSEEFWAVFAEVVGLDVRNNDQLFPQPRFTRPLGTGSRAPVLRDRFAPRRL